MPSELNYRVPSWPDAHETRVFRAVEAVLKGDPILPAYVQTWSTWRGDRTDEIKFPQDITATLCPFLRLSPFPVASGMATEIEHLSPLMVQVELAIVGTNTDLLMNFFGAVRAAVWPQNNVVLRDNVMATIQLAKATRGEIKLPAYGAFRDPEDIPILVAQGSIQFNLLVST